MPTYKKIKWGGYRVRIFAEYRDYLRILSIIPYFWETKINLDMVVEAPKKVWQVKGTSLQYKWELYDAEDRLVKSDQGSCEVVRGTVINARKRPIIKIGSLKLEQCYRLNITLTDNQGNTSEPLQIATFTIKDKDEFKMQIFFILFAIIMALVFSFLFRGCS